MSPSPSPQAALPSHVRDLLARPLDQRTREYRYRFSQACVFGLPVLALQQWGPGLGGAEAGRWVGVLQALLAGWVTYVGAGGMLFEGIMLLLGPPRRLTIDLLVALASVALYLWSLLSVLHVLIDGTLAWRPLRFDWVVILIAAWTAVQWFRHARAARAVVSGTIAAGRMGGSR